jgi:hypothetical protein
VERAYSDFLMYRRDGRERESDFAIALALQAERAARSDPTGYYVSTGFYGEQLARYYECFSATQIMVVTLEALQTDVRITLGKIFSFLGVDPLFVPEKLAVLNRSGVTSNVLVSKVFQYKQYLAPVTRRLVPEGIRIAIRRKLEDKLEKPSLSPDIRRMLAETYRPDVQLLERLTGMSFDQWTT